MTAPPLPGPYRGLSPFEDSDTDARLFFGRERERMLILANLMASRLTVLYGASGVGKSSLLAAGVAHELGKTDEVVVLRSWADDPFGVLATVPDRVGARGDLYLILDQLEEFFVYHGVDGPASALAGALDDLLHRSNVRVSVLLGIREESLAKLDAFKPRLPNVLGNYLRLEHLDRGAARAAITEPLRRYEELSGEHWVIEAALVAAVLDEVSAGKIDGGAAPPGHIETPYLQLVMQRLWEAEREEGSTVLRLATLRRLGGAERIVREHLDLALATLTPVEQDAAARMFDHLVTPSGAKIAHDVGDLVTYAGVGAVAAREVIARLESERIFRPIEEGRVEIYHDVLGDSISTWRRDHEATREVRRARRRARRLAAVAAGSLVALLMVSAVAVYALSQRHAAREQAAIAQVAKGQALGLAAKYHHEEKVAVASSRRANRQARLAKGNQLKADKSADAAQRAEASAEASANDAQSQKADADRQKENAQSQKLSAQASAADALHQKSLAVTSEQQAKLSKQQAQASARRAKVQARAAKHQAKIANARLDVVRSEAMLASDPERAIRLANSASRLEGGAEEEDALRDALAAFRLSAVFPGSGSTALRKLAASGGGRPLTAALFSPDSPTRFVLTAATGGEVRLFSLESRKLVRTFQPSVGVTAASFSHDWLHDPRTLVAGTRDGALLWNVETGFLLQELPHPAAVTTVDFTSDDKSIVTGAADGMVRVWEPASGVLLQTIPAGAGPVRSLSLQPGGHLAVVVTTTNSARVVDLVTGGVVANLDRPGGISVAAFSPRGDVLVAGGAADAYLWDTRTWQQPKCILTGHTDRITDVAFSPDDKRVMTTSADTTARLWTISTCKVATTLTGWHQEGVLSGAISPRNDTYVTGSKDGTAALWLDAYLPNAVVLGGREMRGPVTDVAFSQDGFGYNVLTVSEDGMVRVWRARDPELHQMVDQHELSTNAAFDPRGERLVTAAASGTGRLYTTHGTHGKLLATLALGAGVTDIAYSKSDWFVTANDDGTARLWRPDGSLQSTLVHGSPIRTVAMTPDGRLVATGGDDGRVVVFDRSGDIVKAFVQGAPVTSIAFASPDSVVAGGADGSVKLFSLRAGVGERSLRSHLGAVRDISITKGGLVATASDDRTAHVYDLRTRKWYILQGHAAAVNTVLFSPDAKTLLTASTDGEVRAWVTKTWHGRVLRGRRPPEVGAQHTGAIYSARFSPDSRWIVTGGPSAPGIWQTTTTATSTGDLLYFIRGHTNHVLAVTFAGDNRRLRTASADGTMRSYSCDLCGHLPTLQKLAGATLDLAARGRR